MHSQLLLDDLLCGERLPCTGVDVVFIIFNIFPWFLLEAKIATCNHGLALFSSELKTIRSSHYSVCVSPNGKPSSL